MRTVHHTIDRLEEIGVKRGKCWTMFLERTREGHGQSGEHRNCFKGNVEEISKRRGGAHIGPAELYSTCGQNSQSVVHENLYDWWTKQSISCP